MALHSRIAPFRDARTFVLSLEGEETGEEYCYFAALCAAELVDLRRVRFELRPTSAVDHASSPREVLRRCLHEGQGGGDETLVARWVVFDVDAWEERMLSEVCREAVQRGIGLAVSNPCFELWLLLHYESYPTAAETRVQELAVRARSGEIKALCRVARAGTSRGEVREEMVRRAIARARELTGQTGARWPEFPGTFVVRLFEELVRARALRLAGPV